jgi:hypothetical protein
MEKYVRGLVSQTLVVAIHGAAPILRTRAIKLDGAGISPIPITTSPTGTTNQTHPIVTRIAPTVIIPGGAPGDLTITARGTVVVVTITHGQTTIPPGTIIIAGRITIGHRMVIIPLFSQFQQQFPNRTSQLSAMGTIWSPIRLARSSHPKEAEGKE